MSTYGFLIYLMREKESMEQTKKRLAKEKNPEDRKELREEMDWHRQNYMQFLQQPPEWIPLCIRQYLLDYRKLRPEWREIHQEYGERREFFQQKTIKRSKIYYVIAFAFALLSVLYIIVRLR